jgi:hypothetical protein
MAERDLAALHARAKVELGKIPGVVHVGFGKKEKDGTTTQSAALRVYVRVKRPREELSPGELVPREFEGFPTDVVVVATSAKDHCEDRDVHRPLIGGIMITNFHLDSGGLLGIGTLGFLATINGSSPPNNVVLVSNNHVLLANSGAANDPIFQPTWQNDAPLIGSGKVGSIHRIGRDGVHNYTYSGETVAKDYHVDCATAKIDIDVSSTCDCNCGIGYKNEIRGLNVGGSNRIEGVARVTQADLDAPGDYEVFKVGAVTSKTHGKIIEIDGTITDAITLIDQINVIIVEVIGVDCNNIAQFSASGDSGAALVNSQRQIVGVHFGHNVDELNKSHSCHIHPVLDLLGVTPISTANPPVGPAGQARATLSGSFENELHSAAPLRERFRATPVGAQVYALIEKHREEVVRLVNQCRPATVAWHRSKGPSFLAHARESLINPDHALPRAIDGVTRNMLAESMADVLMAHGSAELRTAVESWRAAALAHAEGFDSLYDLIDTLEREPAHV